MPNSNPRNTTNFAGTVALCVLCDSVAKTADCLTLPLELFFLPLIIPPVAQEFDIGPRLLKECPEFQQKWDEYVNHMKSLGKSRDKGGDTLWISLFLDQFYISKQTHFFPRFFALIEQLVAEGGDALMSAQEILKFIWRGRVTSRNGPELYAAWMGSETKPYWAQAGKDTLEKFPRLAKKGRRKMLGPLHEYKVALTRCEPGERAVPLDYYKTTGLGTATKFGGEPDWIQPGYDLCGAN
jgi:hypothetical protein